MLVLCSPCPNFEVILFVLICVEDQPVVKMIYQKDKYGEQGNLAELEGFVTATNQQQQLYGTSPRRSNSDPGHAFHPSPPVHHSPISNTSPVHNNANQNYCLWSTSELDTTNNMSSSRSEVDSRLSPNAREFTYPATKMSSDYFYRQDVSALSSFASNLWGNSKSDGFDAGRQGGFTSLQSLTGYGWLNTTDATQNYKQNYSSSQLEIMA